MNCINVMSSRNKAHTRFLNVEHFKFRSTEIKVRVSTDEKVSKTRIGMTTQIQGKPVNLAYINVPKEVKMEK